MGVHYFILYTLNVFDKVHNKRVDKKPAPGRSLGQASPPPCALFPLFLLRRQHRSSQSSPARAVHAVCGPGPGQDSGVLPRTPNSGCRGPSHSQSTLAEVPSFSLLFPSFISGSSSLSQSLNIGAPRVLP